MSDNDRPVIARELSDRLDLLRSEQRAEHLKTRAWTVLALIASSAGVKGLALLGVLNF